MKTTTWIFCALGLLLSTMCYGWGVRGHMSICEAAAQLVQHPELATFLNSRNAHIGMICDVPDLEWRLMSQNYTEHRLAPEALSLNLANLPLDYKTIMAQFPGQNKILGSNWWRADQFYRRAVALKPEFTDPVATADPSTEFIQNLGYLGHFVADISQPLHSVQDYDGYASGHGGIHMYYEEFVVDFISDSLPDKIVESAKEELKSADASELSYLAPGTTLEKLRALALVSHPDQELILSLDPLIKNSSQEKGLSLPARRKWASLAVTIYEPVILKEMGHSALLLAQLWDQAYEDVGRPDFSKLKPVSLPVIFNYVMPDYF